MVARGSCRFQLGVRDTLRSFLVGLFVPEIKLRERERVNFRSMMPEKISTPLK
jgi:hypothetical protein